MLRGEVRVGRRGGWRRTSSVQGRARLQIGGREERTLNMAPMVVTLDVSKLSGWLNLNADCREAQGGHNIRCVFGASCRKAGGS